MDMAKANEECGPKPRAQYKAYCPVCEGPVMLHCPDCKIQVTGCLCTEIERFGSADGIKRILDKYGEEEGKARLRAAGLWVPEERRH